MAKSIKSQKAITELQPQIREIRQRFKQDKEKQARETMALYKKAKINPFGSFLPLLIQLPILFALYQVFWKGLRPGEMANLYSFISRPEIIDPTFLGIINLAAPSIMIAVLAGIAQFFQTKMMTPASAGKPKQKTTPDFSGMMQKQMLYFFPLFTVFILWGLPAAIGLYWIVTALFSILQQYFILKPRSENLTASGK